MIYLITRPVVWGTKIVVGIVKIPSKVVRGRRNRRLRKDVKDLKKAGKLG
jgi:hypothetical protein